MDKHIILLNGPSSSGKSTLAKTLQSMICETQGLNYPVISIDHYLHMTTEDAIYEDDVYAISAPLCDQASTVLQSSPGVIIDHVITSQRIFTQLTDSLATHRIHLIRVTCPLEVLKVREAARKNRCLGSAEASYTYLFPQEGYELTVDTHAMTAAECAACICKALF